MEIQINGIKDLFPFNNYQNLVKHNTEGVYMWLLPDNDGSLIPIYIGQSKNVTNRLYEHITNILTGKYFVINKTTASEYFAVIAKMQQVEKPENKKDMWKKMHTELAGLMDFFGTNGELAFNALFNHEQFAKRVNYINSIKISIVDYTVLDTGTNEAKEVREGIESYLIQHYNNKIIARYPHLNLGRFNSKLIHIATSVANHSLIGGFNSKQNCTVRNIDVLDALLLNYKLKEAA